MGGWNQGKNRFRILTKDKSQFSSSFKIDLATRAPNFQTLAFIHVFLHRSSYILNARLNGREVLNYTENSFRRRASPFCSPKTRVDGALWQKLRKAAESGNVFSSALVSYAFSPIYQNQGKFSLNIPSCKT